MAEPDGKEKAEDGVGQDVRKQQPLNFGKRLAHTEKVVRDRGFKTLQTWLEKHPELDRTDYLKLWKGLYFGMWMSDKRHVQQELAVHMALLINIIPTKKQFVWLDAFWEIIQEGWEKLDKWRMNKYLLLVRIVMAEAFKVLRVGGWDLEQVKAMASTYTRGLPQRRKRDVHTQVAGILLQFNRLLWDELRPQLELEPVVTTEAILALLEPLCAAAEVSSNEAMTKMLHEYVVRRVPEKFASALAERLLQGASLKNTFAENRKALYDTAEEIEKLHQLPPTEVPLPKVAKKRGRDVAEGGTDASGDRKASKKKKKIKKAVAHKTYAGKRDADKKYAGKRDADKKYAGQREDSLSKHFTTKKHRKKVQNKSKKQQRKRH